MTYGIRSSSIIAALLLAACSQPETGADTGADAQAAAEEQRQAAIDSAQNGPPEIVTDETYPRPTKQPNFGPAYGSINFVDTDPNETIGGMLTMGRAIDEKGARIDEQAEGISAYMVHWGLEVGAPGVEDDKGAGDHGGDCRGFRDTGHVVMIAAAELGEGSIISWEISQGTTIPEGAVYFVGHTLYGEIHNLGKCTQTPIENLR